MNCKTIKKMIPLYLDGQLELKETQIVKKHLEECLGCREEVEAFQKSWAVLGQLETIEPEPGFIGRFWTRLSQERSWQEKLADSFREGFLRKRLVPALATACLIVIVASVTAGHYSRTRQTDQMIARLSEEDLTMVANIELAENLELIKEIDFLEDLDIIESLDALKS